MTPLLLDIVLRPRLFKHCMLSRTSILFRTGKTLWELTFNQHEHRITLGRGPASWEGAAFLRLRQSTAHGIRAQCTSRHSALTNYHERPGLNTHKTINSSHNTDPIVWYSDAWWYWNTLWRFLGLLLGLLLLVQVLRKIVYELQGKTSTWPQCIWIPLNPPLLSLEPSPITTTCWRGFTKTARAELSCANQRIHVDLTSRPSLMAQLQNSRDLTAWLNQLLWLFWWYKASKFISIRKISGLHIMYQP